MAWRSSGASNAELVENLCRNGLITDARVKAAFLKVDRAHYAPASPYADRPQALGHGATISAPHMHAAATEQLLPFLLPGGARPAPRVLDVGSGSGYLTHVLAELVGPRGMVVGVEHIAALRAMGERNVGRSEEGRALLASGRVRFREGDGRRGWVESGGHNRMGGGGSDDDAAAAAAAETREGLAEGWDAIHVGASAVKLHQELVDQLRRPGRLFIPVDDEEGEEGEGEGDGRSQHIWTIDKDVEGRITKKKLFGVRYVPLTDAPAPSKN